jgi:hypothetical protein
LIVLAVGDTVIEIKMVTTPGTLTAFAIRAIVRPRQLGL